MIDIWTGRKSQWNPKMSGFHSVDAMRSWCESVAKKNPDLFVRLFVPFEEGDMVRFKSPLGDVDWVNISDLPTEKKKALRWDYHQWRSLIIDEIGSERRPIGFMSSQSGGPINSTPFDLAQVKLFAGTKTNGEETWGLVWGMKLDNEKENFLPPYASRESRRVVNSRVDQQDMAIVDAEPSRFQTPTPEPTTKTAIDDVRTSELGKNWEGGGKLEVWFIRNRNWLSVVSIGTLVLGTIRMFLIL